MADPRDDRVSAAYRELPGEGPPAALDAAIQAAARRAVGSRPARSRRWQVPLSIAAVLALAIGVSLQVEREKPVVVDGTPVSSGSAEYPVPQAAPEKQDRAQAPVERAPAVPAQALSIQEAPRAPAKEVAPVPEMKRAAPPAPAAEPMPSPAAVAPAPAAAPANVAAPATMAAPAPVAPPAAAPAARIAPAMSAPASPPAAAGAAPSADALRAAPQGAPRAKAELSREETTQKKAMSKDLETPEQRLERVALLRARGLHDEADRELAEFRRAFPDYRLTDEWRKKVERP